jgi:hypothetical protein
MAHGSEMGFDTTTETATEILLNTGVEIRKASIPQKWRLRFVSEDSPRRVTARDRESRS